MFLRRKELQKRYPITSMDVANYLRWNHIKNTPESVKRVTNALRAAKIREETGRQYSFSQAAVPWGICYGRARMGGVFTFVRTRAENLYLDLVLTLTGHEIAGVDRMWLDTDEVIFGASPDARWSTKLVGSDGAQRTAVQKVFKTQQLGTTTQTVDPDLINENIDMIPATFEQRGCAYAYCILVWDYVLFPDGLPDILFELRGKPVYDPRTAQTAWTDSYGKHIGQNAALVIADFMTDSRIGMGIPSDQIDWDSVGDAADICEESVTLADSTTERRYTINGTFDAAQSKRSILEQMVTAMAGGISYSNGKYKLRAGKYTAPVLTLTDDDWVAPLQLQTKTPRQESFNAVRGTYLASDKNYEEREFPVVKNEMYRAEDGEQVIEDIQLPFTVSASTAQRLAKIFLESNRQGITLGGIASLRALQLEVGDTVAVTRARLGWSSKTFMVQEIELVSEQDERNAPYIGVRLLLSEFASGIFEWANGEETTTDLAPNTNLPNPHTISAPSNLQLTSGTNELYLRSDGTVFTRIKVSWAAITDAYVTSGGFVEIWYQKSSERGQPGLPRFAASVPGDQSNTYILDVQDGEQYDVYVRAKNASGIVSSMASVLNYVVQGKSEPPSTVQGLSGSVDATGVRLRWDAIADKDVAGYEIRYGADGITWESATIVGEARGTSFATNIVRGGTYSFLVKAKDTTGNYSTVAAILRSIIPVPEAPLVTIKVDNADLIIAWVAPESYFSVDHYEVTYSAITEESPTPSFSTSIAFMSTKALSYRSPISWTGTRWFYVYAVDVNGNIGDYTAISLQINAPGAITIVAADVVDNNVLIRWAVPSAGTLPIKKYQFFRGDSFASASMLGETGNTFATIFENVSGSYTYWLVAVDTANNKGPTASVTLRVSQPPDFVFTAAGRLIPIEARLGRNVLIDGMGFVVGAGGPGGAGSPMGLLACLTYSRGSAARVSGVPLGLLLALTYARTGIGGGSGGAGSPFGCLLSITRA